MRYLGGVTGDGMLKCQEEEIGRASYDFDFYAKPVGMQTCGEIRLAANVLERIFGRRDLQLLTDDGRLLDLTFSEKKLLPRSEVAHVDVSGEVPSSPQNWHH